MGCQKMDREARLKRSGKAVQKPEGRKVNDHFLNWKLYNLLIRRISYNVPKGMEFPFKRP